MEEIRGIIHKLKLPPSVTEQVLQIYEEIALAESAVHRTRVNEIHLHEVGMMDAIADITCVAVLLDILGADRIVSSPVTTGYGFVRCAHGVLPVPAPATALLLKGVPTQAGQIEGELCTPTGAALIAHYADTYGNAPAMKIERIGYGFGKKEFTRLNCLRAFLGAAEPESSSLSASTDRVLELSCNIDDMTGEELGFAAEELLAAGALDVWMTAVQMKKMRPGTVLALLCREEERDRFVRLLFRLSSTIGVRETLHRRYVLDRTASAADTPLGSVNYKRSTGYGVSRAKAEYEDLKAIARREGLSLREAAEQAKPL